MKHIFLVLSIMLLALSFAFGGGQKGAAGDKVIELDMWATMDLAPDQLWGGPGRGFLAEVEKSYPNIKITYSTMGERDIMSRYIAAFGAGDPPDIVQQYLHATTKMVRADYFRPVDDLFAKYEGRDNFREGTLEPWIFDGKLYGIPGIGGHHYIFYYRKDWFADAGISKPDTWEKVIKFGQAVTGDNKWGYGHAGGPGADQGPTYFQMMVLSAGGKVVDGGKAVFNSKIGKDVAQFQRDWIAKYKISPETIAAADDAEIEGGFRAGVYGSYIDGIWEYLQMSQDVPDLFPNVGVAPVPKTTPTGKHVTYNDNFAFFMPSNIAEEKIEAAFEMMTLWIRMTDEPYGKLGGFLPILKDVQPAFEDPEVRKIMLEEVAPSAVPVPRLENLPELNDLIAAALGKILLGDTSAEKGLDDAAKRFNSMYAE
jgi:ABC-type glycerol-3-phosphate transport system substrate-binding protein